MSEIDELIEFMRGLEADHLPEGWPAVRMQQITALCDHIDRLWARVAELERSLKSVAEWLDGDTNSIARDVGIGVCSFNDIYRSTEHCIEKIINPALLNQIEGGV